MPKAKQLFCYQGGVTSFGKEVCRNWRAATYATSEKQAISNLLFQARRALNLAPNAKLELTKKPALRWPEKTA